MTKMLRITSCADCPFSYWVRPADKAYYSCSFRSGDSVPVGDGSRIPSWCPLPDAPAWPSVPVEVEVERDPGTALEAPAVLRGVNLLEEVQR